METQRQAALEAMCNWLTHPGELGRRPAKIEHAGEFELHGMRYYMFRFKKGLLGGWMLGVCGGYEGQDTEHCGHVFSHMQPYEAATAQRQAEEMVEFIRAYWMERARALEAELGEG